MSNAPAFALDQVTDTLEEARAYTYANIAGVLQAALTDAQLEARDPAALEPADRDALGWDIYVARLIDTCLDRDTIDHEVPDWLFDWIDAFPLGCGCECSPVANRGTPH